MSQTMQDALTEAEMKIKDFEVRDQIDYDVMLDFDNFVLDQQANINNQVNTDIWDGKYKSITHMSNVEAEEMLADLLGDDYSYQSNVDDDLTDDNVDDDLTDDNFGSYSFDDSLLDTYDTNDSLDDYGLDSTIDAYTQDVYDDLDKLALSFGDTSPVGDVDDFAYGRDIDSYRLELAKVKKDAKKSFEKRDSLKTELQLLRDQHKQELADVLSAKDRMQKEILATQFRMQADSSGLLKDVQEMLFDQTDWTGKTKEDVEQVIDEFKIAKPGLFVDTNIVSNVGTRFNESQTTPSAEVNYEEEENPIFAAQKAIEKLAK